MLNNVESFEVVKSGFVARHRYASVYVCRYVSQSDLQFFREKVELEDEAEANNWSHMMDLSYEDTSYSAWRRSIQGGKTEYKSITITPNATAEEFMDFYLDDPTRPKWDSMISGEEDLSNYEHMPPGPWICELKDTQEHDGCH